MSSSSAGCFECPWPVQNLTDDEGRSFLPFRDDDFELRMVQQMLRTPKPDKLSWRGLTDAKRPAIRKQLERFVLPSFCYRPAILECEVRPAYSIPVFVELPQVRVGLRGCFLHVVLW